MQHLITLQQIRDQHPCRKGWSKLLNLFSNYDPHHDAWIKLLNALGNPKDLSVHVSVGDIAKSNGVEYALWCARCVDDRRFIVSMIMPAVKRASKHATDQRVHDCIAAVERWLGGDDSVDLHSARAAANAAAGSTYTATFAAARGSRAASTIYAKDIGYVDAVYAAAATYAARSVTRAAYAASEAVDAADVADYAIRSTAYGAERQRQVEDIIAVSPLYALK